MTVLRKWIWFCMMGGLLLAMLAQAVAPIPRERLYIEAILDAGHVPLFSVFTLVLLSLLLEVGRIRRRPRALAFALAFAVAAMMGLVTEYLQSRVSRDADLMDFERDLFGAGAAILLSMAWTERRARGTLIAGLLVVGAGACVIAGFVEPAAVLLDYRARDESFPVLASFDDGWEETFLTGRESAFRLTVAPDGWAGDRGDVLVAEYEATDYPALTLREPQSDWSAYTQLEFDVFNGESTGIDLLVRIDDNSHNGYYSDRYNGRHPLDRGANRVTIQLEDVRQAPRSRSMNLHAVRSLTFFLEKVGRPVTLYFDDLRLVSGSSDGG
jgi:hypothetical protein